MKIPSNSSGLGQASIAVAVCMQVTAFEGAERGSRMKHDCSLTSDALHGRRQNANRSPFWSGIVSGQSTGAREFHIDLICMLGSVSLAVAYVNIEPQDFLSAARNMRV